MASHSPDPMMAALLPTASKSVAESRGSPVGPKAVVGQKKFAKKRKTDAMLCLCVIVFIWLTPYGCVNLEFR